MKLPPPVPLNRRRSGGGWLLAFLLGGLLSAAPVRADVVVTNCGEAELVAAVAAGGLVAFSGSCNLTLTAPINIAADTILDGNGQTVTVSGGNSNRIFNVASGVNLTIRGLTLSNGTSTNGGALFIASGATVQLTNCTFSSNRAIGSNGLAGANGATNTSIAPGGGNGGAGTTVRGGAIYNLGALTLRNCSLLSNTAVGGSAGNGGSGGNGDFQGGNGGAGGAGGAAQGGAIYNGGVLTLRDCAFSSNAIQGGNAGTGGAAGTGAFNGWPGIGGAGGVALGAGVYSTQTVTVVNCTFADNTALGGHSAAGGTLGSGNGSTGNRGGDAAGAGVCSVGSGALTNCTFYTNRVTGGNGGNGGAGDFNAGNGGDGGNGSGAGLYSAGNIFVVNCTFAAGSAFGGTNGVAGSGSFPGSDGHFGQARGGGLASGGATFTLKNTLIATNHSGGGGYGTIVDAGNNLSADASLSFGASSFKSLEPKLGAFGTNGGFTQTLRPLAGSPAIDAGDGAVSLAFDQRGVARPSGTKPDIGAVEVAMPVFTLTPASRTNATGSSTTFAALATGEGTLAYRWRLNGTNISGATATNYTIATVATNHAGDYTVVVTNSYGAITSTVAKLTVVIPPSVTTPPTGVSIFPGGSATFTAAGTGTAPLGYQWQLNGANLAGATTTTLQRNNAQVSDAGYYTVVITNAGGSVTSQPAILKVLVTPTLGQARGSRTNFQFAFSSVMGVSYVVEYKNDLTNPTWTPLFTNTGNGGVITQLDAPANLRSRFYRVIAR